ncbi:thiamine ABC transporter substrate binding subunit [Gammaproteobacteria bacterium]|nr:thiamine ABC transporter substrate binding subunit [Gammaproteobacteria bacterium]
MNQICVCTIGALFSLISIVSHGQEKPKLTVYTYDAFAADWGPGPKVKQAFEAVCGCVLEFVATDSSIGILRKIQLEGESTKADIALGLDTNLTTLAAGTGLFAPVGGVPRDPDLPVAWHNPVFVPFDFGYFAFVFNSEIVKAPPTSFEALAAMPDEFKIIIQDPRSSTPGLGLLLWVRAAYGDKAAGIWKKLAPRILTITKGWSDAYGLFLKGEAEMVLSYTTSPAYHLIAEDDDRFDSASFEEGHYMQIEVAAMLKSSKQQELAGKFLAFLSTDTFQSIIPTTNWMFPAWKTGTPLPAGFSKLRHPQKSLLMDSVEVEQNRKQWIAEWLRAIGQ